MGLTVINSVRESEQISLIEESLQEVFNNAISDLGDCNANLKFLNAKDMKILNYQFRNKNVCTNVLAFPNDSFAEDQFLGDIAICYDFCRQEAIEQKKPIQNHIMHMLLHALLHLMGYDHQTAEEAVKMEKLEIKMLSKLNIPNPYILI